MANKIGYHIQAASAMEQFFSLLQAASYRSAGFTVVGSIGQITNVVNRLGPATDIDYNRIIGRETVLEDGVLDPAKGRLDDPRTTAKYYLAQLILRVPENSALRKIKWQVFNEKMDDYDWTEQFVNALIDENNKLAVPFFFVFYNYATGNPPDSATWDKHKVSLGRVCADPKYFIGQHEYGYNGKMLGVGGLETYRIGRYKDLLNRLVAWGYKTKGKLIINEYGLDDPGYIDLHIPTGDYAQQCIDASVKYYEPDEFVLMANVYDCSLLAGEYNVLPQNNEGTDETFFRAIDAHIVAVGQNPIPTPVPTPIPTPTPQPVPVVEEPVATFVNGDFSKGFSKASADWNLPVGWSNWQSWPTAKVHYEDEMHPTHVKQGFQHAARFYTGYEPIDAGLYQVVSVTNGELYKLSANVFKWSTQHAVVDTPSELYTEAYIGIDPTGGTNPFSLSTVWVEVLSDMDKILEGALTVKALSNKLTVFLRGVGAWPVARNDFFWSNTRLVRMVSGGVPVPVPVPTTGIKKLTSNANLRSTPIALDDLSNKIAIVSRGTRVNVLEEKDGWSKIEAYIKTDLLGEGG